MTTKKTAPKTAPKKTAVNFNLPKTPKNWDDVKSIDIDEKQLADLPEYKGFELWLAPFTTPDKAFRVTAKIGYAVIHIVTWQRRFLAKLGKTKALYIAEI
jgi:hypothetical protein